MRHYKIILFLLFTTMLSQFPLYSQWKQKEFIFGTFADPNLSIPENHGKDVASFRRAKDMYINLLCGPQFYTGSRTFSMMDRALKVANEVGMKLLVIDSRMHIANDTFNTKNADFLIKYFKSVDTMKAGTLYGYYWGGEFSKEKSKTIRKWVDYFKEKHPGKLIYTYLLPRYGFKTNQEYEEYLDDYLNRNTSKTTLDVAAFDYYPFIQNNKRRDSYFYNLKVISQKAGSRPFWIYVLTTKHLIYPDPDKYQLNFMSFCPLAYGAKGLLYFTYETLPKNLGNYEDALIGRNGQPTNKYYIIQKINRYIHDIVGPIIMTSQRLMTVHTLTTSKDENIASQQLTINNPYLNETPSKNLLIGVFSNQKKSQYNFYVVNTSNHAINDVQLNLNSKLGTRYSLSVNVDSYDGKTKFSKITPVYSGKSASIRFALSPGEGRVIQVSR